MSSTNLKFDSRNALALAAVAAIMTLFWLRAAPAADNNGVVVPVASTTLVADNDTGTAVLAGGCFWGMEEVFRHVKGVNNVVSGYAGGTREHANYRDSSSGRYGDAEAVRIRYDPSQISYSDLLQVYFSVAHDPTQVNRQGPDRGPQYRSQIFASNESQARVARAYIHQLEAAGVFDKPIATKISVGKNFFEAEAYHQNYAQRHPNSLYIRINDAPKVAALKKHFTRRYREQSAAFVAN